MGQTLVREVTHENSHLGILPGSLDPDLTLKPYEQIPFKEMHSIKAITNSHFFCVLGAKLLYCAEVLSL